MELRGVNITGTNIIAGSGGGGTPGVDNVIGYLEFSPPIIPGNQTEDSTATVNGTTGITINDDSLTGLAFPGITVSNQNWLANNYPTPGTYTCAWGPGSTVASSSINVIQTSPQLVFYVLGQSGPATYNYPYTLGL